MRGFGDSAVDRDLEIRRLSGRLRILQRFGIDICLGRMTPAEGEPIYIGRTGLAAADGTRLLVDWRTPAAEPYFAATMEDPRGIVSRRRYRWTDGLINDYWDEALTPRRVRRRSVPGRSVRVHRQPRHAPHLADARRARDDPGRPGRDHPHALPRRARRGRRSWHGKDGRRSAPGRAAAVRGTAPDTGRRGHACSSGRTLHYLAYVEDVLPSLGEDTVRLCTLRDLVPEGATAVEEPDPRVASLKASLSPDLMLDAAARSFERPPQHAMRLESPWADLWLSRQEWGEVFAAADPAASHNEARDDVWEELLEILVDQVGDEEVPPHAIRRWLRQDDDLTGTFVRAWPLLSPTTVVERMWSSPDLLRHVRSGAVR